MAARPATAGTPGRQRCRPHGWTVRLAADKADTLSCLVWELTLTRTAEPPAGLTLDGMGRGGRRARLRPAGTAQGPRGGRDRGEAVLRSEAPTRKGDTLAYYEVQLERPDHRGGPPLHSASKATARPRIRSRSHSPTKSLAKLAGDIAGAELADYESPTTPRARAVARVGSLAIQEQHHDAERTARWPPSVTAGPAPAAVVTKVVEYEYDGTKLKGFLAYDDAARESSPACSSSPSGGG